MKLGEKVFDLGLRRAGIVIRVFKCGTHYVECADGSSGDSEASELRTLNPDTEAGKHNAALVEEIERLLAQFR